MSLVTFIKTKDSCLIAGDDLLTDNGMQTPLMQKVFEIGTTGGIAFTGEAGYINSKTTTSALLQEFARNNKKLKYEPASLVQLLKTLFDKKYISLDLRIFVCPVAGNKAFLMKVSGNKRTGDELKIEDQSKLLNQWYHIFSYSSQLSHNHTDQIKNLEFYFKLARDEEMHENLMEHNSIDFDNETGIRIIKRFYSLVTNDQATHKDSIGKLFNILVLKEEGLRMLSLKKR
jgi:hypothetical protein